MKKIISSSLAIILTMSLMTACTNREMGTVGGAAVGGIAGNVVTGGSAMGTAVGAVGGAVIGNQLSR
jgi:osmotically inducible lipoprotein OsmB